MKNAIPGARPARARPLKFTCNRWLSLALIMVFTSCSEAGRDAAPRTSPSASRELVAQVASYDMAVGEQRFLVGLLTHDQNLVGHGTVQLRFGHLGEQGEGRTTLGPAVQAKFLPIPEEVTGPPPPVKERPEIIRGSEVRGVYSANASFDRPGFWGVQVTATPRGRGTQTAEATFQVWDRHRVPWIGEEAPRTENLTVASTDAPPAAIDSRASGSGEVPDAGLHQITVAQALAQKKPVLLVISTPVYCVSRFCGPITDMVSSLSQQYSDRAAFVHIEVWRDFEKKEINRAAAEWILRENDAQEPWVFLIGADGKIAGRWDNVATRQEIEPVLQQLPPLT